LRRCRALCLAGARMEETVGKTLHEVHHKEIRTREHLAAVLGRCRTTARTLLRKATQTFELLKKMQAASQTRTRVLAGRGKATLPRGRPRFPMDVGLREF
jgi:hypothetical protein